MVATDRPHPLRPDRGVRGQSPADRPIAAGGRVRCQRLYAVRQRGDRARRARGLTALYAMVDRVVAGRNAELELLVFECLRRQHCVLMRHRRNCDRYLDHPDAAAAAGLRSLGHGSDVDAGPRQSGPHRRRPVCTLDLLAVICDQLGEQLPGLERSDMALNNLERFVAPPATRCRWARCSSAIPRRCRSCCRSSPPASTSATC